MKQRLIKRHQFTEDFYNKLGKIYTQAFSNLSMVNSGGCGWSAYVVCKILRSKGIPAEIYFEKTGGIEYFINNNGKNFDKACRNAIRHKRAWEIPNHHIMIKVGDRFFDSDGEFSKEDVDLSTRTSLYTLKRSLKEAMWNRTFIHSNENVSKKKVDTIREFSRLVSTL